MNTLNKYQSIIIDGNNLFARNYFVHKNLTYKMSDETELITGGIYGFIYSLNKLKRNYLSDYGKFYILFDNYNSSLRIRKEIDPNYKKNRKEKSKMYYRSIDLLQQILLNYDNNIVLVYRSEYEADDLVKPILNSIISEYDKVLLVSNDLDWARMIDFKKRYIEWLVGDKIYNNENFKEKYGYYPSEKNIILWKTFRGDDTDDIPIGVPGIRKKILLKLMNNYVDILDIMNHINEIDYLGIWKDKIIESEKRLRLNYQLVSYIKIGEDEIEKFIYSCEYRPNNLKIFYNTLGFNIETFDSRVYDYIKKEEVKNNLEEDDFFKQPEIRRI